MREVKQVIFSKGILVVFLTGIVILIFRSWISSTVLSSGDWIFFYEDVIRDFPLFPAWDILHDGLGKTMIPVLWLESYFLTTTKFGAVIGLPWIVIERLFWFYPFIFLSIVSSWVLVKTLFQKMPFHYSLVASMVFSTNTYSLMVVGGGQMGVALAYATAPLVIAVFIALIKKISLSQDRVISIRMAPFQILAVFLTALQLMFDIRIAYITVLFVFLFLLFFQISMGENPVMFAQSFFKKIIAVFIVPGVFVVLLHAYWILPLVVFRTYPPDVLGGGYTSLDAVRFFSFAQFENSFSLLHPNWPENIFGKTGFMKPEFILLPLLAYMSLFFITKRGTKPDNRWEARALIVLVFLGIIGAFLAKGANEPFGGLYLWLFEHVPGFFMFRDPTKFYLFVAVSYSVLIPHSLQRVSEVCIGKFQIKKPRLVATTVLLSFLIVFLYLLRPAFLGTLKGTFAPASVPREYLQLRDFLSEQSSFFRTLWMPRMQRFGYHSKLHPAISATDFFKTARVGADMKKLSTPSAEALLSQLAVKYVIVPYDSKGELFVAGRTYNDKMYRETVRFLDSIGWLKRLLSFGKIVLYEISHPKDHFWIEPVTPKSVLQYTPNDLSSYSFVANHVEKGQSLIFSESFDPNWVATVQGRAIPSLRYNTYLNSFQLPKGEKLTVTVSYLPARFVAIGLVISGMTFVFLLCMLALFMKQKYINLRR